MSYQLYRNTTLGHTLQEALDELMQLQLLSPTLALKVLLQFDKSINTALNTRLANTYSQIHLFGVHIHRFIIHISRSFFRLSQCSLCAFNETSKVAFDATSLL